MLKEKGKDCVAKRGKKKSGCRVRSLCGKRWELH